MADHCLGRGSVSEHSISDGAHLTSQDELRSLYRSLADLGIVHCFAPSYYIEAFV